LIILLNEYRSAGVRKISGFGQARKEAERPGGNF